MSGFPPGSRIQPVQMVLMVVLILSCGNGFGQDTPTPMTVADAYMAAYNKLDFDKMGSFYTDQTRFRDPTYDPYVGNGKPYDHTGRDAIVSFLKGLIRPESQFKVVVEQKFASKNHVVMNAQYSFVVKSGDKSATITMKGVTVLHIENGHVLAHTDYGDYESMLAQYAAFSKAVKESK